MEFSNSTESTLEKALGYGQPNTLEYTLPNHEKGFGEARLGGNLVIFAVCKLSGHSGIVELSNPPHRLSKQHWAMGHLIWSLKYTLPNYEKGFG